MKLVLVIKTVIYIYLALGLCTKSVWLMRSKFGFPPCYDHSSSIKENGQAKLDPSE